ncbi:MAG: hypothetical protein NT150_00285 [Bacteroidetes bacterium]|nr:hypothetical protein [Bacteroidota bacterium]
MTFKSFVLSLPLQQDPTINWVITFVKSDANFPDTDDIEIIAKHVYLQLNEKQTLAFQKALVMYWTEAGNLNLMQAENHIVDLQDADDKYLFKRYQY